MHIYTVNTVTILRVVAHAGFFRADKKTNFCSVYYIVGYVVAVFCMCV